MKTPKGRVILGFAAVSTVVAVGAAGAALRNGTADTPKRDGIAVDAASPRAVTVTVDPVSVRSVQRNVDVVGSLFGLEETSVGSRASGTVKRIRHDIGDVVRPGDVLLEIDPVDAELAIAEARRSLDVELAKLGLTGSPGESLDKDSLPSILMAASREKLARINLDRVQRLGTRNASTTEEIDTARAAFDQAAASHRQAVLDANATLAAVELRRAALDSANQRLRDCQVVVPTPSGVGGGPPTGVEYLVAERTVSEGETVQPSSTLFRLVVAESLKLRAFVPERHLAEIKVGQSAEVEVDAYPGETFEARVERVNPTVDRASRTFQVELLVPNAARRLSAGCFAVAAIRTRLDPEARTVADEAVVQFAGVTKVFAVRDGKAVEVPVTMTGLRIEGGSESDPRYRVEVVGALRPGEPVVTSGQSKLTDGVAVVVREEGGRSR